jgi:hypothetical protein
MTLGQAARRAIELGGKYDGHEAPADVNKVTKASVAALAGQGLVAAARDNYGRDGMTHSYVAAFAEIEVDVETGKYYIVDFLAYADVGTVIHPRALGGQILGRSTLGIGPPRVVAAISWSFRVASIATAWAARVIACVVWLPPETHVNGRCFAVLPHTTSHLSQGTPRTSAAARWTPITDSVPRFPMPD